MTKREIIDEILLLNRSAEAEFLAEFEMDELQEYLRHLQMIRRPRLNCIQGQFDKYFENIPAVPSGKENPTATIIAETNENEIWPQDPCQMEEPPVEQMLFDELDDQLEENSSEHVSLFAGEAARISQGQSEKSS